MFSKPNKSDKVIIVENKILTNTYNRSFNRTYTIRQNDKNESRFVGLSSVLKY